MSLLKLVIGIYRLQYMVRPLKGSTPQNSHNNYQNNRRNKGLSLRKHALNKVYYPTYSETIFILLIASSQFLKGFG